MPTEATAALAAALGDVGEPFCQAPGRDIDASCAAEIQQAFTATDT